MAYRANARRRKRESFASFVKDIDLEASDLNYLGNMLREWVRGTSIKDLSSFGKYLWGRDNVKVIKPAGRISAADVGQLPIRIVRNFLGRRRML